MSSSPAVVLGPLVLAYFAYSRPGYFTSQTYLGGLLLLEFLAAAVWMYRRVFFPIVVVTFLLAGVDLPVGSVWTMARWVILGVGAVVGSILMLKERRYHFGLFHVLALFAVLAALVSAAVSRYTSRLAVEGSKPVVVVRLRWHRGETGSDGAGEPLFCGLLTGCEVFVGAIAACYFVGMEVMGNPNSLGAVMGVVGAPILLWGTLVSEERVVRRRRLLLYAVSMYLTFASHARAGMVAALLSCGLLCLVLRRYRLLMQGVVIIVILVAAAAILQPRSIFEDRFHVDVDGDLQRQRIQAAGLMASRQSPWQDAVDTIHNHFWFGTGFGTSDNGQDASENLRKFATTAASSKNTAAAISQSLHGSGCWESHLSRRYCWCW